MSLVMFAGDIIMYNRLLPPLPTFNSSVVSSKPGIESRSKSKPLLQPHFTDEVVFDVYYIYNKRTVEKYVETKHAFQ